MRGSLGHLKWHSFKYAMGSHWREGNRGPLKDAEQENDVMKSVFKKLAFENGR